MAQDVAGVGAAGEVVAVSPGYARNCLVPLRLAVPATAANQKLAAAAANAAVATAASSAVSVDAAKAAAQRVIDEAAEVVARLTQSPIVVRVLVDKAGAVRVPVTATRLLEAVRVKKRVDLSAASLVLRAPLASLGEHSIPLRFDARHVPGTHALTVLVKKRL